MEVLLTFLISFFVILIVNYIFNYIIKGKNKKLGTQPSYTYIVKKYKLNMDKQKTKTLSKLIVFINSLIIAIPITVFMFVKMHIALVCVISFVLFILLMFSLYNIIGIVLKKKGW